ncbi:hypothetical protein P4S72_03625 [Vibrio sp. PP-XX7]
MKPGLSALNGVSLYGFPAFKKTGDLLVFRAALKKAGVKVSPATGG